ncbi:myb-like protein X [Cherax quadricarinatus]
MVTEATVTAPKVKMMKVKKNKMKKAKKKLKKGLENVGSESEGNTLDLNQKLYPLSHYVSDQEELVNHMFTTIRGSKLEAMLPPILRNIPVKELKKLCLHELRGMSKKRILCCINGQVMEGSSGSEEDEEEEKLEQQVAPEEDKAQENTPKEKRKSSSEQIPEGFLLKKIKVEPGLEDTREGQGPDTGKSVLELLELEMRARIIKTMLEKGDEGKKIAEDAIAAVMQSAKQITKEGNKVRNEKEPAVLETVAKNAFVSEAKSAVVTEGKETLQQKTIEKEVANEEKKGDKSNISKDERSGHRRHHRSRNDDSHKENKRGRNKRERSHSDRSDGGGHRKRSKEIVNLDRHVQKKKKITRKEFEERMKRAKKNRTYRQRKTSEDEEKVREKDESEAKKEGLNKDQENGKTELVKSGMEGEASQSKPEEASGEVSEKEEGELDSNEEEEGACTPSGVSSVSSYSSSPSSLRKSYSSRSRSRSYSRSCSRSPIRRKRRRRRRSYTRSRTRSKSQERKNKGEGKRSYERQNRELVKNDSIGRRGSVKIPPVNTKENKEDEENWGQKCDIEFVDSEEDFDDSPTKETAGKKPLSISKSQIIERASISFSLQKKPAPNITPSIDLDDLPLKQSRLSGKTTDISSGIGIIEMPKCIKKANEEIVISSDSDSEKPIITITTRKNKKVIDTAKQVASKQTVPFPKKDKMTKSQPEVKIVAEQKNKIDESVATSLIATAKHHKNVENIEDSKKLNSDSVDTTDFNTQLQNKSEFTVDIDENEDIINLCQTAMQGLKLHSVDTSKIQVKIGKGVSVAMEVPTVSDKNSDMQIDGEKIIVDSSEKEMKDASHTLNSKMGNSDVPIVNKQDDQEVMIAERGRAEPPEISHSISKLINRQENHDSDNINITCKAANIIESESVTLASRKSISLAVSCDSDEYLTTGEASKNDLNNRDNGGTAQQDVTTKTHEICTEVRVSENGADKEHYLQEHEDRMREHSFMIDSQSKECIAKGIKEIHEGYNNTSEEYLKEGEKQLAATEEDSRNKESENTEDKFIEYKVREEPTLCSNSVEDQTFTEEEKGNGSDTTVEIPEDEIPAETIRIETGLIRRRVLRHQKVEMQMPGVSWTRKERKKKEKSRNTLVMEGIGFLKNTLTENAQNSPLTENENASLKINKSDERLEIKETDSSNIASLNETNNSFFSEDITPSYSTMQSPKDVEKEIATSSPDAQNYQDFDPKSDEKSQKRSDQETEIIGVIETSKDSNSDNIDDIELGGSSWSMRWLQSEKVQKVVTSSKMLSRVRKKIQKKDKATKIVTEKVEEPPRKPVEPLVPVIGSIEEYERLFGTTVKKDADETSKSPGTTLQATVKQVEQTSQYCAGQDNAPAPNTAAAPTFGSDDEGEDSEEEALWSKILGKG